jgi:L-threonylcarbamoyladenylate synthase
VDLTVDPPAILRPGGIPAEAIEAIIGEPVLTDDVGPSRAPGMLASHYAPRARVEVVEDPALAEARVGELLAAGVHAELLCPGPDPDRFARHLYAWLREADARAAEVVIAVPPPAVGLGWAVRDRLRKAAGPR